ncbi:MAG TPA: type II toxin-antitoxin system VapB family antitoxin [Bryobacteraceae bacterium]|jgi:hypothetical protein|nr:type II toxin-antitoxin system VapB family antitoxin [Bryobacteraceae bacterium]
MRTTLVLDEKLLDRAREVTGIREETALVHAGLEALIAREAGKRLAKLGGTQPKLAAIPRPVLLLTSSCYIAMMYSRNTRHGTDCESESFHEREKSARHDSGRVSLFR